MTNKEYYMSLVNDALTAITLITLAGALIADIIDGHLTALCLLATSLGTGALTLMTKD